MEAVLADCASRAETQRRPSKGPASASTAGSAAGLAGHLHLQQVGCPALSTPLLVCIQSCTVNVHMEQMYRQNAEEVELTVDAELVWSSAF